MFQEGEDVLMRAPDGLVYLGVLVEVEPEAESPALVRFGDGTEKWAKFGDLRRIGGAASEQPPRPASTSRSATPLSNVNCVLIYLYATYALILKNFKSL